MSKLTDKIDIVDFIGKYVKLEKSGENYKGLSPFKEEKTPSFVVNPNKNIFKCFSTGLGGNVVKFYALIKNIDEKKAYKELCNMYDIKTKSYTSKNDRYYELLEKVHNIYIENLKNNTFAKDYLIDRGYTEKDIEKFELGYADNSYDDLYEKFKDEYSVDELLQIGIVNKNDNGDIYNFFRNRIIIPIYDKFNNVIAFGGRSIFEKDKNIKYINSKESFIFKKQNEIFSTKNYAKTIQNNDVVVLMEGYFDVLTSIKYGLDTAVASLGTSLTENQAQMLSTLTKNIIIAYDNDTAGKNALIRATEILVKYDFNIKCFVIRDDSVKDPDEFLNKYGYDKFYEEIKLSESVIRYLFNIYAENKNISEISVKSKIITQFENLFNNITDELIYNEYITELSTLLDVDKSYLEKKYKKNIKKNGNFQKISYNVVSELSFKKNNELESEILRYILYNYNEIDDFRNIYFEDEENSKILTLYDKEKSENEQVEEIKQIYFFNKKEKYFKNAEYKYDLIKKYMFIQLEKYIDYLKQKKEKMSRMDQERTKITKEIIKITNEFKELKTVDDLNIFYEKIK